MLNKAPTMEDMQQQLQRGEAIAQAISRQRDEQGNRAAILEAELLIERAKTEAQTKQIAELTKRLDAFEKPAAPKEEDDGA